MRKFTFKFELNLRIIKNSQCEGLEDQADFSAFNDARETFSLRSRMARSTAQESMMTVWFQNLQ